MSDHDNGKQGTVDIDPAKPVALDVSNVNGRIAIRQVQAQELTWRAIKRGTPGTPWYDEMHVAVDQDDNRVRLVVEHPFGSRGGGIGRAVIEAFKIGGRSWESGDWSGALRAHNVSIDLEIDLPAFPGDLRHVVHAKSASGDVAVHDLAATMEIATAAGEITLRDCTGEAIVHSASGDVAVTGGALDLTARTASGEVRIDGTALDRVGVTTMSGDALISGRLAGTQDAHLESMSGDIRLALSVTNPAGATVAFRSMSGEAKVEDTARKIGRRTWRVGPGDEGGATIGVKTMSGDLDLRLRHETAALPSPPLPPLAPAPPPAPDAEAIAPPDDDRLALLHALERGEIDIDEAMRQLDGAPS